jgi:hypothetical protein
MYMKLKDQVDVMKVIRKLESVEALLRETEGWEDAATTQTEAIASLNALVE